MHSTHHSILNTILVTGGAGFIGSNFIRYVLNKYPNYKVINLDKLTYAGNLDNLEDLENHPNYKFIKGDICDAKLLDKILRNCDIIAHFAAETHVDRSILSSDEFLRTNVSGVNQLLKTALNHRIKKIIHISTDEVYGSIMKGKFRETDPLNPSSLYSSSKAAGDMLALSYYTTYKLPVIITRSSNNFGPYQFPEKVIPLFITNVLEGIPLPLYGDGLNVRDWIFVEDNCRGIDFVMQKGRVGEIYNIGGNCEKTNKELTVQILKLMNKPKTLIKRVKDRPGHDRRYALNCSKIHGLGWRPEYSFIDALELTIDWYSNNPSWWQKIKQKKEFKTHYKNWYSKRQKS